MTRHLQVVRGGLVLEHAAGQVEGGTMARTEETAFPVIRQRWLRTGREPGRWRAAEVGTDTDGDQDFRFDRAPFVDAIGRRELVGVAFGFGVGDFVIGFFEGSEHLRRALQDPDQLAAPFGGAHFAWLEGAYQGSRGGQTNDTARRARGDEQAATA